MTITIVGSECGAHNWSGVFGLIFGYLKPEIPFFVLSFSIDTFIFTLIYIIYIMIRINNITRGI